MESEIENKPNLIEQIIILIKKKKKLFFIILIIMIIILASVLFLNYHYESQNEKISEKYIKAGIYLSSKDEEKAKNIYKEIILSKNKFYSLLALNNIIEKELEENSNEILKLFEIVESIKVEKEQKNLIKLKKALYLIQASRVEEGNKLIKEIISDNSIWKETTLEMSK